MTWLFVPIDKRLSAQVDAAVARIARKEHDKKCAEQFERRRREWLKGRAK